MVRTCSSTRQRTEPDCRGVPSERVGARGRMMMMREGLLWYDNDPKCDLEDKVLRAARRYRQKYGISPNVCYVHPSVIADASRPDRVEGVQVAVLRSVLPNHYWLGNEEGRPAPIAA